MSSMITIAAVGVGVEGYNAYEGHQNANSAKGMASQIMAKQNYYDDQLKNLMSDPSSFFKSPIFTSAQKIGLDATAAQGAASGNNRSSTIMKSLFDYGQGFAAQQLQSQESLLAGLTGAQQSAPAAIQANTNAQGQSAEELVALSKGAGSVVGAMNPGGGSQFSPGTDVDASGLQTVGDNPFF